MTTRGSLARGQGQQPQQFQGHVQRWTKQWVPAGSAKGASTINLLKWVPTGDRSETPGGPRVPHLVPVKDPDVKARLLGQRAPPDAATGLKPDAARAGFQAPADVGGNPSAPANEVAARQPEGSSALMGDAPGGFALEGVSDEPSGPSAPEQVSSGLPGEAPALSAEGASMQIDQEAPEDSMPPPRLHRADPAALGSDVPMEVEGNIPVV